MAGLILWSYLVGITAEAAEPRRLTDDGTLKLAPVFASAGKEIVFSVHGEPNQVSLKRLNLAEGSQTLLEAAPAGHQFDANFSADGRYLCFAQSAKSPQLVLVIRDTKEKTSVEFRPQGGRATVRTPRFTPDSNRVVFTLSSNGGQQIASVNRRGEDLKRLTQSIGTNCWPSVSPDGKHIAFSSSRDGGFKIYIMNSDGSGARQLTRGAFRDIRPAWSPDGKQIAFTSARDGNYEIYVIRPDGTGLARVTNHPDRDDYPTWHPDGKHLLTVSQRDGEYDLYLFDVPPE